MNTQAHTMDLLASLDASDEVTRHVATLRMRHAALATLDRLDAMHAVSDASIEALQAIERDLGEDPCHARWLRRMFNAPTRMVRR